MNKVIPQDLKRNKNNDQYTKDDERYEENSRRHQYYSSRDRENDSNSEYQQLNYKCDEYHTDSGRPLTSDSKQYGWTCIISLKNAGRQIGLL